MRQLAGAFDRMFERLEKLFNAERQFTSDASHELRTPTAIILAECDRAERKADSVEDYEETIGHIREQGERMSGLIDELLGITRLQQGTERYPLSEGDLSEFVTLSSEEFVPDEEKGIRMETDIEDGIMCSYNASLISRVIFNLLQNAYRYGKEDGIVRLSLKREDGSAVLRVSDNGRGIAAEDIDKIWQRFWQADSSRGNGGSGLGLAMVKEIADLHGGSVAVKSTVGKGSEFSFSIPAQQS
jgi:signal transduction histidine kinase